MSYRNFIKRAASASDAFATSLHTCVPFANPLGAIHGLASGKPTESDLRAMDSDPALGFVPGVGASRSVRRLLDTVQNKRPRRTIASEALGPATSALLLAAAGAGLGALSGVSSIGGVRSGALTGASIGLLAGAGINGAGLLAGILKKRRTAREAAKADAAYTTSRELGNYLVPGAAAYRMGRRYADITRREDERNARVEAKSLRRE